MGLLTEIRFKFAAKQTGVLNVATPAFEPAFESVLSFVDGVVANQADRLVVKDVTLGPSANEDVDLAGVLVDVFGAAVTFAKLVGLIVIAKADNVNNVRVGLGTNPFTAFMGGTLPTYDVFPGGLDVKLAPALAGLGSPVGGASDILRFANSAGTSNVTFRRILLGRST